MQVDANVQRVRHRPRARGPAGATVHRRRLSGQRASTAAVVAGAKRADHACRTSSPTTSSSPSTTRTLELKPGMTGDRDDHRPRGATTSSDVPASRAPLPPRQRRAERRQPDGTKKPAPIDDGLTCSAPTAIPSPVEVHIGVRDDQYRRARVAASSAEAREVSVGGERETTAAPSRTPPMLRRAADAASRGRQLPLMTGRCSSSRDVWKVYQLGDVDVQALRGVLARRSRRASSWR